MALTDADPLSIAWAAGLYEGEGWCGVGSNGYPHVSLKMTDQDIVERFRDALGVGSVSYHYPPSHQRPGWKPTWAYETSGWNHVAHIRELFAPWLGPRRLAQFDKALENRPPDRPTNDVECDEPSEAGYRRHLRRGEPPCRGCRAAHRDYERERTGASPRFPDGVGYRVAVKAR